MSRVATWENIGRNVEGCKSLDCVLQSSGLDYTVIKKQVYVPSADDPNILMPVPKRFCTMRDDGSKTYDVVSDRFEIVQNSDAFDFVQYMGDELTFLKAGETANGMVYIIAALPSVNILGDTFTPNVIFRNGFGGQIKITAAIIPLRIICQNQFNIAFREAQNAITVRHMRNAEAKLAEARDVLKMSADYMVRLNGMAKEFYGIKHTAHDLDRLLDQMFPIPVGEDIPRNKVEQLEMQRLGFKNAYLADDNYNFRGTAWGLVNAYTDFVTHKEPLRQTKHKDDNKFMTVTFSPMNAILQNMAAVGIR